MASEGEHVDGVAEDLQSAAKGVLQKSSGGDAPASGFIQNVAHIVLDKSNQAADSSKAYIENAVLQVQDYAQNAGTGSTANIQAAVSRAVHAGATPAGDTSTAASGGHDNFLTSVATWCSSLCGYKSNKAAGEPGSIDFRAAAENVAQVLHSSTTPSSSVATPSPHAVAPEEPAQPAKPTDAQE